jgi:hypothetical protein
MIKPRLEQVEKKASEIILNWLKKILSCTWAG